MANSGYVRLYWSSMMKQSSPRPWRILHKGGYDIVAASDGEDAIQAALLRPPELVISDIMLPA
jgi:PleD family two-component response regulator